MLQLERLETQSFGQRERAAGEAETASLKWGGVVRLWPARLPSRLVLYIETGGEAGSLGLTKCPRVAPTCKEQASELDRVRACSSEWRGDDPNP